MKKGRRETALFHFMAALSEAFIGLSSLSCSALLHRGAATRRAWSRVRSQVPTPRATSPARSPVHGAPMDAALRTHRSDLPESPAAICAAASNRGASAGARRDERLWRPLFSSPGPL